MALKHDWKTGKARPISSEQMRGKELILPDLSILALLPDDPTGSVIRKELANACGDLSWALSASKPDGCAIYRAQMHLARLLVDLGSGMLEAEGEGDPASPKEWN